MSLPDLTKEQMEQVAQASCDEQMRLLAEAARRTCEEDS